MPDDQELVEQAKTDPAAIGELYDRYYPRISGYILRRVGDLPVAQDLTSNVFFKALGGLPRFEWRGFPFSAWLYRIASNEVNSYFRSAARKPVSLEELYEVHQVEIAGTTNLEQELIDSQAASAALSDYYLVRRLLEELPLSYQEALALRYFEKKPVQEVADILGKNLNTTKSLLSRGIEKLRKASIRAKQEQLVQPAPLPGVIQAEE